MPQICLNGEFMAAEIALNGQPVGAGVPGATWKTVARHYIRCKRRLCGIE